MFLFWQSKSFYHLLIGDVVKLKKLLHKSWSLTSPHPPLGFGSRSLKRDSPSMTTVLGKRCCLLLSRVASTCWTLAMGSQFLDLTCVPLGKKKRKNFCFYQNDCPIYAYQWNLWHTCIRMLRLWWDNCDLSYLSPSFFLSTVFFLIYFYLIYRSFHYTFNFSYP